MATNYFLDFPLISYSLDNFKTEQVVTDILKRVVFTKEFKENSSYFQEYFVVHGETPEQISHRFYGTTQLHWLILLVNEVIDPRFEWPTTEENLVRITQEKYGGEDSIFTVRNALDSNGRRVETFFLLTENSTHDNQTRLMLETDGENFTKQPILWLEDPPNTFRYETHYDIENDRNEKNRTVKILKPNIVSEILTKYKELINS
jgi:hypothetical protein